MFAVVGITLATGFVSTATPPLMFAVGGITVATGRLLLLLFLGEET
jgi:hypothetical protein